jgi:hypothetical protein
MRARARIVLVALIGVVPRAASGEERAPAQLPKKCAAESPMDTPCTAIAGRYQIELAPRDNSCVVTRKVTGVLTISGEGRKPAFDAKSLVKALGLVPKKGDEPVLGAAIRDGVCCIDLRLFGHRDKRHQRVMVHMAAGATKVGAKADDRWIEDPDDGMCGDEELDVTVTRLPRPR